MGLHSQQMREERASRLAKQTDAAMGVTDAKALETSLKNDGEINEEVKKNLLGSLSQKPDNWKEVKLSYVQALMNLLERPAPSPRVVPLLVTDDIEAALTSRSMEQIQSLAFALSGQIKGVGVGFGTQNVADRLQAALGRSFNSTFTVARVSDNTVRLRFGALLQPSTTQAIYSMIPQNHNVTLLVMVPKTYLDTPGTDRRMHLVSQTTLVDTDTGKELTPRWERAFYVEKVLPLLRKYHIVTANAFWPTFYSNDTVNLQAEMVRAMLSYIDNNDFGGFENYLKELQENAVYAEILSDQFKKNSAPKHGVDTAIFVSREALWAELAREANSQPPCGSFLQLARLPLRLCSKLQYSSMMANPEPLQS